MWEDVRVGVRGRVGGYVCMGVRGSCVGGYVCVGLRDYVWGAILEGGYMYVGTMCIGVGLLGHTYGGYVCKWYV